MNLCTSSAALLVRTRENPVADACSRPLILTP
jgi:hypothetical protein